LQIVAGLLLALLAGSPLAQLQAAEDTLPATNATTVPGVDHTIWTTPGELVNFRFGSLPNCCMHQPLVMSSNG